MKTPDVQFSRIRFLGCTRIRAGQNPDGSGPQGGWRRRFRSAMSGMRVLSGRHASVESCPVWWAFPTAEYDARYDSPTAYGGRSRCQSFSAFLAPCVSRHVGASRVPSPGFPCCASRAVDPLPSPPRVGAAGVSHVQTLLFLQAMA